MHSTLDSTAAQGKLSSPEDRALAQRILIDLIIIVLLLIPIAIYEFAVQPFQRGFFCSDETIHYPFLNNTVTPVVLGVIVGVLPLFILIITELFIFNRRGRMNDAVIMFGFKTPTWLVECSKQIVYFAFGMVLTFDATEVGKYTIGRLRPHFMAVCQPQFNDGTTCLDTKHPDRYVTDFTCLAHGYTAEDVRQARLSFPSGHSSLAFYALVYCAIYLQRKVMWRGSKLMRHFVQFSLIMLAWFTALTRVMDNWHHWSDVLLGSIIGIVTAFITAHLVARMFETSTFDMKMGIPRQDTTTTLQEVITTPPPYSANSVNSFSNEQYCTKV